MNALPLPKLRPMVVQARLATPWGPMVAAATERGLAGLWFDGQKHHPGALDLPDQPEHPMLRATAEALAGYARAVDAAGAGLPPLDPHGTPFQRAVWRALTAIPAGRTATYASIARAVGRPAAVRAVGAAVGRNPISVLVPCHRVVGSDGTLTGYAGGLARKQALLEHECRTASAANTTAAIAQPVTAAA